MHTFEFTELVDGKHKSVRYEGDELVFPLEVDSKQFFRVYRHTDEGAVLVYATSAYRVDFVRTVDPHEEVLEQKATWTDLDATQAELRRAIKHLELTLPKSDCAWVDGDVLESGVRTCMTHQRPGSKPGTCAVNQARLYLDREENDDSE